MPYGGTWQDWRDDVGPDDLVESSFWRRTVIKDYFKKKREEEEAKRKEKEKQMTIFDRIKSFFTICSLKE